ncbi:MAG: NUDIX hydrolase [Thermoleophilaceae bacterium]
MSVEAAGGVIVRDGPGGSEICVVHRPHREDWSLPKGKLDAGESFEEAALREVLEETGLTVRLGEELASTHYEDQKGRPKVVRYWRMAVVEDPGFEPNDEVDQLRWLARPEALTLLSYAHDRELVASL